MVSEKGWYWVAVGVLALGVSNSFVNRHTDWAHGLADRSTQLVGQLSGHADRYAVMLETIFARGETGLARTQTTVARVQTRVAFVQADMVRRQADIVRLQTEKARMLANVKMHHVAVVCPQQKVRIDLPQPPAMNDDTI
jgi:hypothetical protein